MPQWFDDWPSEDAARAQRFLAEQCRLAAAFPLPAGVRDLGLVVYVHEP